MIVNKYKYKYKYKTIQRLHSVEVITLDFDSNNPGSNPGATLKTQNTKNKTMIFLIILIKEYKYY
jgi:hypothetical protein